MISDAIFYIIKSIILTFGCMCILDTNAMYERTSSPIRICEESLVNDTERLHVTAPPPQLQRTQSIPTLVKQNVDIQPASEETIDKQKKKRKDRLDPFISSMTNLFKKAGETASDAVAAPTRTILGKTLDPKQAIDSLSKEIATQFSPATQGKDAGALSQALSNMIESMMQTLANQLESDNGRTGAGVRAINNGTNLLINHFGPEGQGRVLLKNVAVTLSRELAQQTIPATDHTDAAPLAEALTNVMEILAESLANALEPGNNGRELGAGARALTNSYTIIANQFAPNGQGRILLDNIAERMGDSFREGGRGREVLVQMLSMIEDQIREAGGFRRIIDASWEMIREQMEGDGEAARALRAFTEQVNHSISEMSAEVNKKMIEIGEQANQQVVIIGGKVDEVAKNIEFRYKWSLGITAGVTAFLMSTWFASRIIWNKIDKHVSRPRLITKSSEPTFMQRISSLIWQKPLVLKEMIFSQELWTRLNNIKLATKNISQKIQQARQEGRKTNVKYRNLLLWGPPGTGKTMFAEQLAKASQMQYAFMSGASFSKFESPREGIEAMDELFAWAENSEEGLIIFIDEADAFLASRKNRATNKSSGIGNLNHELLTHFLNYTGTRSNKYMLIFASNDPAVFDEAMKRRIDDSVEIKLPETPERIKILCLYRDKLLLDPIQNTKEFIESVRIYLNDDKIEKMAEAVEGLSCGELEGIINTLKTDADITDDGLISEYLIDNVVQQAKVKNADFESHFGQMPLITSI